MKNKHTETVEKIILVWLFYFTCCANIVTGQNPPIEPGRNLSQSQSHPKAIKIKEILDKIVNNSIPGAVAAIDDEYGFWVTTSGFARIEDRTPMEASHLHYLQSISKTYMAVAILKLYEENKIDLDAPITQYLPNSITSLLKNADKVTVKMLLNHTSGLPEYNYEPLYITRLLQNPSRMFRPVEYLEYIKGKELDFESGSRYSYRNTNYVVLSLIADHITGDHGKYIENQIFKPLNLQNTFYRIDQGNTYGNRLVNSYWDRHSTGILENITVLQNTNVASMVGDDGIITTAEEAVLFLKGLIEFRLLKPSTLEIMQEWVLDKNGNPTYGLGLNISKFAGYSAIGHDGGGLGAGCQLYYFPEKNLYIFLSINLGTVTESPIHKPIEELLQEIYQVLISNI